MKRFLPIVALLAIFHIVGCQQAAAPPRSSQTLPNASENTSAETTHTVEPSTPDADQPDDPGMTKDHDKTVKQEQPSGDESSRAAPNEGDAEPPQ